MNSLTARFSVNRAWCFVVGREYDVVRHAARVGKKSGDKAGKQRAFTTTPTRQRVRNDEDAVSFEIGLIMGGAMGLGMSLYFLDPKTPIKTGEHSIIRAIWPTMADALEKSVLESEKPEKVIERIESSYGITPQRAAYISLMSFMMFRTSRRYWSRRWGDLEWQRSVVFMPWATTVGIPHLTHHCRAHCHTHPPPPLHTHRHGHVYADLHLSALLCPGLLILALRSSQEVGFPLPLLPHNHAAAGDVRRLGMAADFY